MLSSTRSPSLRSPSSVVPDRRLSGPAVQWQREEESAAAARLALERDVAAHGPGEPPADREPQARSLLVPFGLAELLEDRFMLVGRDAGTGVAHGDRESVVRCTARLALAPRLRR